MARMAMHRNNVVPSCQSVDELSAPSPPPNSSRSRVSEHNDSMLCETCAGGSLLSGMFACRHATGSHTYPVRPRFVIQKLLPLSTIAITPSPPKVVRHFFYLLVILIYEIQHSFFFHPSSPFFFFPCSPAFLRYFSSCLFLILCQSLSCVLFSPPRFCMIPYLSRGRDFFL